MISGLLIFFQTYEFPQITGNSREFPLSMVITSSEFPGIPTNYWEFPHIEISLDRTQNPRMFQAQRLLGRLDDVLAAPLCLALPCPYIMFGYIWTEPALQVDVDGEPKSWIIYGATTIGKDKTSIALVRGDRVWLKQNTPQTIDSSSGE